MTTNNIQEVKGIDADNFDYLLAESNFKIDKSMNQWQRSIKPSLVPVIGELVTLDDNVWKTSTITSTVTALTDYEITGTRIYNAAITNTKSTIPGVNIPFTLSAQDNAVMDLRDSELELQAQYYYELETPCNAYNDTTKPNLAINTPTFGNQTLLSLFSRAELYIDNQMIAANEYPGFSSNAEYALRYPHCKTLEKDFEIGGFVSTDKSKYKLAPPILIYDNTTAATSNTLTFKVKKFETSTGVDIEWDDIIDHDSIPQGTTCQIIPLAVKDIYVAGADGNPAHHNAVVTKVGITGFITQRIKLSDMFSVVDTLPPIFNHDISIKLTRAPTNHLICNTHSLVGNNLCYFLGFQQFKWWNNFYYLSDKAINTAKQYYNKPIETIITQDVQIFAQTQAKPAANQPIPFNLNIEAGYKNKLLTICIPRCNAFSNQFNQIGYYYDYHNTAAADQPATYTYISLLGVDNTINYRMYDILKAPGNSYTCGFLRELEIKANGALILYDFTMQDDGHITGKLKQFRTTKPETMLNYGASPSIEMDNYEDVYKQYVRARLHFQQSEDEALDFETFLKEYCIYCIDLSPFDLPTNQTINVKMVLSGWRSGFNPFCAANTDTLNYQSPSIICNLFKDKILRLEPGRKCGLLDMLTPSKAEEEQVNQFVN